MTASSSAASASRPALSGAGGEHLGADPVALDGLDERPRDDLAGRTSGHGLRQLAREGDELLDEQRLVATGLGERDEPVRDVVGVGDDPDALAVVATARGLDDGAAAVVGEEGTELVGVVHGGPVRYGQPELGEPGAHHDLVLGDGERLRSGVHGDPGVDECAQDVLRDVFVVEGDHVDLAGERQDGVGVVVVALRGGGDGRRHAGPLGQHPDVEPELDRCRHHHPSQLSSADDPDAQRHAVCSFRRSHRPVSTSRLQSSSGSPIGRPLFDRASHDQRQLYG